MIPESSAELRQQMWNTARLRAKRYGREFTITKNDFTIPARCPILGMLLGPNGRHNSWSMPSLDRIDNSKGYVPGNVAVISWRANSLKSNLTLEEAERLINYMKGHPDELPELRDQWEPTTNDVSIYPVNRKEIEV